MKAEAAAGREVVPADLAASFQEAIVDVQVDKTIEAADALGVSTILLGGGVVATRGFETACLPPARPRGAGCCSLPRIVYR